jgi:thioredoxin 1
MTIEVTDDSFEANVLQATGPILLDFSANWCGPCRMIAPILEEISEQYAGRLTVAKLDIDDSPKTPSTYGVQGIPTLILFKNGEQVATKVGSMPKGRLIEWIESVL